MRKFKCLTWMRRTLSLAIAISVTGCTGGDYGQRFRWSSAGPNTELEWCHRWEPRQFLIHKTCQGQFEALKLLVGSVVPGKALSVPGKDVEAVYEHGASMSMCDKSHRVEGTVSILDRSSEKLRVHLDVTMFCPDEEDLVLKGDFSFDRNPGDPGRIDGGLERK